jgi:hypothetical protein
MLFLIQMIRNHLTRKLNIIAYLTAENLALRHQLIVLKRHHNRPKLKEGDRVFWKVLSNFWLQLKGQDGIGKLITLGPFFQHEYINDVQTISIPA